ncbi:hypothetical protein BH18ACT5_BH18ACT5_16080 [soil metagenome]
MDPITVSIDIDAPIERVWDRLADLEGHKHWMGDVGSLSFDNDKRQGLGTVMTVATQVGPLRLVDRMLVTVWDPPRRMTVEHQGAVKGAGQFILSPVGGATRLIWIEELHFPWRLGGPITALGSRPVLATIWLRNLRRFKRLVE